MHNTQSGEVVYLGTNASYLVLCLQASEAFAEDPDEAGGVTMMEHDALAPPQDSKTKESAFTVKTADAEAPQPCTLVEAKCIPDKPPEEPIEKPVTSKVHPIVQEPHQMGGLYIDDPLSAPAPHLTDPAPASATKHAITHNVPHCRAVNTSNWAVLATCPDTTFLDINGSMAIDWHATSGCASHIDNGTICWPLRQQEDVSSTTPENDHITAMHGGKEASCPCSPAPDTSGSFTALTTSISDTHPPLTFSCDCQYHPPDCTY
jgi:hypothetical protein